VEVAGKAEMWVDSGEALDPSEILEARAPVRAATSSDLVEPQVRLMPSTFAIVGSALDVVALRERYDAALLRALHALGVAGAAEMCDYGMPSDYRGWLSWARERADEVQRTARDSDDSERIRSIAEEIAMGTSAIALSMREGHTVTPYITAVAVKGLEMRLET
jgi:hypothetical protein